MKTLLGVLFLISAASVSAMAIAPESVPEINPASAVSALAMLGGALVVVRARLKK